MTHDAVMITNPGAAVLDENRILCLPCCPTDNLSATLSATDMSARIGSETKPSIALLECHVHWIDDDLNLHHKMASTPALKKELAQAGFADIALWLGWLRSGELFGRVFSDTSVVKPCDADTANLLHGCGALLFDLGLDTKGGCDLPVDVVMAHQTFSGFKIGRWFK